MSDKWLSGKILSSLRLCDRMTKKEAKILEHGIYAAELFFCISGMVKTSVN
jgi:hypothetical protein